MAEPYRENIDRLGQAERETAAVVALGAWRGRTRTGVLLGFCLVGVVVGIVGVLLLRNSPVAAFRLRYVNMTIGFCVPFIMFAVLGRMISTMVLRRRTPGAIQQLSTRYQIEPTVLVETARAVDRL